jgi:hypothetical protein
VYRAATPRSGLALIRSPDPIAKICVKRLIHSDRLYGIVNSRLRCLPGRRKDHSR